MDGVHGNAFPPMPRDLMQEPYRDCAKRAGVTDEPRELDHDHQDAQRGQKAGEYE
jgi:hypothetical protein